MCGHEHTVWKPLPEAGFQPFVRYGVNARLRLPSWALGGYPREALIKSCSSPAQVLLKCCTSPAKEGFLTSFPLQWGIDKGTCPLFSETLGANFKGHAS